jgi:hypothetical protein
MKLLKWLKQRLVHKLQHIKIDRLKKTMKENGLALVVIIIVWEVIEDILFPIVFIMLGKHIHPIFLAGAPASWLLCFHWIAVPVTWRWWIKLKGLKHNE